MSDEQTTPNPETDGTQSPVIEATPANGGSPVTIAPDQTGSQETESGPTPEQIEQWRTDAARVNDAQAEITRQQQANAELRAAQERNERMLEAAMGREQALVDPSVRANKQFLETLYGGDEDAALRAMDQRDQLREQNLEQRLSQKMYQQMRVQQGMVEAQQMGYNESQLQQTASSLTPQELALISMQRENKLSGYLSKQQEQVDQNARRASVLGALAGESGSGMSPGQLRGERTIKQASHADLSQMNSEARKLHLENPEYDVFITDLPPNTSMEQAARDLLGKP